MAKQRINRELIRQLQDEHRSAPRLREIYDDQITGFGVRITPKGTVTFLYRWTTPDGKQDRRTILLMTCEADVKKARDHVLEEIRRLDHARDTPAVRVLKHARRAADAKSNGMPTLGEYLDGDYRAYWLGENPDGTPVVKPKRARRDDAEKEYAGATKSETPKANLTNIRRDFADLMDVRLDEITRKMIAKWVEGRVAAKYKPSSINRTLGALGGLFSHAVKHEIIDWNPCAKLRQKLDPDEAEKLGRELTPAEEKRLRSTLDTREQAIRDHAEALGRRDNRKLADLPGDHHSYVDHVKPAILLAINTGMRRSELLRLRWTAINWSAKTLTIEPWTTKVKRERVLPLNEEALAVLKAWRRQVNFEFVFTNEVGERLRAVRDWAKITKAGQIEDFRFMDTRHHTATRLVNEGVQIYHVQKILGHKDSRMTQRYLKAREAKLHEALALLDQPRLSAPLSQAA